MTSAGRRPRQQKRGARRRAATCGPRRKNRDASGAGPRGRRDYHDDDFRYEDTVEDAREAFIFFVVVACFVCCCCGSCAARRLARRNYPHGRELRAAPRRHRRRVALGSSGEDWPCPVCAREPALRSCSTVAAYRGRARARTRTKTRLGRLMGGGEEGAPRLLSRTSFLVLPMRRGSYQVNTVAEAGRAHRWRRGGRRWYRVARRRQFTHRSCLN